MANHPQARSSTRRPGRTCWRARSATAPHYLLAERDGVVAGVLPLMHLRTRLFGNTLVSTPFCVYGGPLAADAEAFRALCDAAAALREDVGAAALELRLLDPPPEGALDDAAWPARDDLYVTFRRAIAGDDDANLKAIPRKQRAMVRKGIERGLSSRVDQDVDGLHGSMPRACAISARRCSRGAISGCCARRSRDRMDVLTVSDAGAPVASVLNFYWRDEVLPYYGGGTAAARACHANDFMYWEVMRRAGGARLPAVRFRPQQARHRRLRLQEELGFCADAAAAPLQTAAGRGDPGPQSAQSEIPAVHRRLAASAAAGGQLPRAVVVRGAG